MPPRFALLERRGTRKHQFEITEMVAAVAAGLLDKVTAESVAAGAAGAVLQPGNS
jgi:hypothetical protein